MTEKNQVYKCDICGNIVEVLHKGGELVCCGKSMILMKENTVDADLEKHVPVIEQKDNKINVKVGSISHPMIEDHYIEWIELICDFGNFKYFLEPGEEPNADFDIRDCKEITARAYCNIHGLWKSK